MQTIVGDIKIFSASANPMLAQSVVGYMKSKMHLDVEIGNTTVTRFDDGEISMRVRETVRGADVFIIQSTSHPVNDNLMELLIMIDAMRRSSAGRITAVIPYFGYARQDRRAHGHDPISAKLVADILTTAGANRIATMDLHAPQIQGFFNIPLDHFQGVNIFADFFKTEKKNLEDVVVVSPDFGSVARCNDFATKLDKPLAIVDKRRDEFNIPYIKNFIGEVEGKNAILVDDVLSTGSSLCNAADEVIKHGAKSVRAFVTHPVLAKNAVELIASSALEELFVLDTIQIPENKMHPKIKQISVAPLIARAIESIHNNRSVGKLSRDESGLWRKMF